MFAMLMMLAAILEPGKAWFAPHQPIEIKVETESRLVLTDFAGKVKETKGSDGVAAGVVDIKAIFPDLNQPGTYVLYAVPPGKQLDSFVGTPLVIQVLSDKRRGAPPGPMVVRVEPLSYVVMTTNKGPMTIIFYYDVAPNTARNFINLSREGYFDGLTFHRIEPAFVIQGGDPRGDGTGNPGYQLDEEFNTRPHDPGVLSMARSGDPNESPAVMPRSEFANSAGSQFFICLDYRNTQQLDRRFTVFGKVVSGMDAVEAIAAIPIADPRSGRPAQPAEIQKAEVKRVDRENNPYASLLIPQAEAFEPATRPATQP